ncbi:DUF3179 domain-containing protein [Marinomonas sp. S3726]|uniref:DUF3179 domain-containing protein n=1 Tax=Marinomonas sp. S3726 TaxID=579484 RepID=UPI000698C9BC|nr:DUF3179 domain-containing protein [Marinomonas sp. S3726]
MATLNKKWLLFIFITLLLSFPMAQASFFEQWPKTDFTKSSVNLEEVMFGGPGKDGIPAIDSPKFVSLDEATTRLNDTDPIIGVVIKGEAKAYPLRVLIWHEIVNDVIADVPVAVTYCPLCNTSIVFDRRIGQKVLDFGTTGNLRHSDLIMYDRQTQSWWQQYEGNAIVGDLVGTNLRVLASRLESFADFKKRAPNGQVLVPNNPAFRDYNRNPYVGYDSSALPFLFKGKLPKNLTPMMRVIAVDGLAVSLPLLSQQQNVKQGDLSFSWHKGQSSVLDTSDIGQGRDVGNVLVTRNGEDVPYIVTFAFAYFAFNPDGKLYTKQGEMAVY